MNIREKIWLGCEGLYTHGAINIVVLGDSVSHGEMNGYFDQESVYGHCLRRKLNKLRGYMPINLINAAISGATAKSSVGRLDRDVLSHHPDLIIICFGLNDVNGTLEDYIDSLRIIFEKCTSSGCETIFMTPNMLNTSVAEDTSQAFLKYARTTAEFQNGGRMDRYIYSAVKLAEDMGVEVCDCYSRWKEMAKTRDVTYMLANRINHPLPEFHEIFSDMLYDVIMRSADEKKVNED